MASRNSKYFGYAGRDWCCGCPLKRLQFPQRRTYAKHPSLSQFKLEDVETSILLMKVCLTRILRASNLVLLQGTESCRWHSVNSTILVSCQSCRCTVEVQQLTAVIAPFLALPSWIRLTVTYFSSSYDTLLRSGVQNLAPRGSELRREF